MYDRNVEFPNRYQLVKVEGTDDVFDIIPAPGEVAEEGTMINKSTLLSDAVAASFGLGNTAVPNDVLNVIKTLFNNNDTNLANINQSVAGANTAAQNALNVANSKARVASGSYTGTGQTSRTITCGFAPRYIFINTSGTAKDRIFYISGTNTYFDPFGDAWAAWPTPSINMLYGNSVYGCNFTWGSDGITMSASSWRYCFDNQGVTFYYVIIG